MYFPYFRGKQFELIAIRDTATLLARSKFVPIIEPVRAQFKGLSRALDSICTAGGSVIVVVNPTHGDMSEDGDGISKLLNDDYLERTGVSAGLLLTQQMTVRDVANLYKTHRGHNPIFIHAGFMDGKALAAELRALLPTSQHVFFDNKKLYQKHFAGAHRVLLRDGFDKKKRNADYPPVESFSDLHVTYTDETMDGFGDFLTVGDDFSESGGPAYAVAIHLTFIDAEKDDEMFIYHFVSDRQDTPTDPAGKFAEALRKLALTYEKGNSQLFEGTALKAFLDLHERGHFPGLGQVKKLSIVHHIETMARYFS